MPKGYYKRSEEQLEKMRNNCLKLHKQNLCNTEESNKKRSETLKKHWSENKHPRKGIPAWNSGKIGVQESWCKGKTSKDDPRISWGEKQMGPDNPNWRGGVSCDPYCDSWLDKEYKESIKKRDDNKCLNPYCFRDDNRIILHHINYIKKDCTPKNLISICQNCNLRANKDRRWHTSWYQGIMYRRYGYEYCYD